MRLFAYLAVIGLVGCTTMQQTAVPSCPPKKTASFDFTPPSGDTKGKNPCTFLLIHPRFNGMNYQSPLVQSFVDGLRVDFVEMITARGYNYKGPVDQIGNVVYGDKRDSDLLLEIEVDMHISDAERQSKTTYVPYIGSKTKYFYRGMGSVSGKVNLIFSEPFTGTKLQVKSILIEETPFSFDSCEDYDSPVNAIVDPQIWNEYVRAFGIAYSNIVTTAWKHLDPEEVEYLRMQSLEVRKESVKARN